MQVFGARGVHSGAPVACPYLPAAFVGPSTALPASVQLQLCLARLRHFASFETIVAAGVQHPVPSDTELTCDAAVRVTAAGKLGLCRGPALANAGHASHVTQLLHDPMDPARIAFALACGAAGVLRSDTGRVTHTFNPAPLRPRNEGVTSSPCICPRAKATLAWSADGRILYKLLDQHTVADPIDASNMAAAGGGGALRAERHGDKDDRDVIAEKAGEAGWLAGALIDDIGRPMPGRKAVYALDVTPTSALRCSHGSHGSAADAHSDASLPFCLDWQMCDTARGSGAAVRGDDCKRVHVRFEAGATDGGEPLGPGLALPTPLASGVALMRTHVPGDVACSLGPGKGDDTAWLTSLQGIAELRVG